MLAHATFPADLMQGTLCVIEPKIRDVAVNTDNWRSKNRSGGNGNVNASISHTNAWTRHRSFRDCLLLVIDWPKPRVIGSCTTQLPSRLQFPAGRSIIALLKR